MQKGRILLKGGDMVPADRKKLPVGIESFEEIRRENFYYVDKTGFIKELLGSWGKVNLFTRPRRFGKTLTMDMLKTFFEIDTDPMLFQGLEISRDQSLCRRYMGQFPVVFLSLKSVSGQNFSGALKKMGMLIRREARRLQFLLSSDKLTEMDKRSLLPFFDDKMDMETQQESLMIFSEMLYKHYGKKVILLIDEYDVPLDKAYEKGYYNEMAEHIRATFEIALKTNDALYFAVLTGCLRISKESIFTGLNNFSVHTIMDAAYDEYFGFTDEEVRGLLEDYGLENKHEEIRTWYDGYRFGKSDIYCPWDVLCYVKDCLEDAGMHPQLYWVNTSENAIVRRLIRRADANTKMELEQLIAGNCISKVIRQELTYPDLDRSIDHLWSVLFVTGYLTLHHVSEDGRTCGLMIPNREIHEIFEIQIRDWFMEDVVGANPERLRLFCDAFQNGDAESVEKIFGEYLRECISIRDTYIRKARKENFYHGMLLGLLKGMDHWVVQSNAEAGDGFSDISIKTESGIGCVIEMKYSEMSQMETSCKKALRQIEEKRYAEQLQRAGCRIVYLYGITCYKKSCRVLVRQVSYA